MPHELLDHATDLYETDFYQWTQEQAALLAARKARDLDWTNLAEEIASLGRSDKRALVSHLDVLLLHLLKWQYEPTHREESHSWQDTIAEARSQIAMLLDDSPSLHWVLPERFARRYLRARQRARDVTRLPLTTFPECCPWSLEDVLCDDFWPEA